MRDKKEHRGTLLELMVRAAIKTIRKWNHHHINCNYGIDSHPCCCGSKEIDEAVSALKKVLEG